MIYCSTYTTICPSTKYSGSSHSTCLQSIWKCSKEGWKKANAVLELAHEGYLSDVKGVVLYEKAGIDKYGLQKYKCLRGTNKVEGGPHGDIYRKFGAFNGMHIIYSIYYISAAHNMHMQLVHILLSIA
jgi:hypothetical protein